MIDLYFIRHSLTRGNLEKRYIGTTDESLCDEGIELLSHKFIPQTDRIFVSPMKRCLETASILFKNQEITVVSELRECDFGIFENKNYMELSGSVYYQQWIDSNAALPFPDGESREVFAARCLDGFNKAVNQIDDSVHSAAFVVHGGTIMSILEQLAVPRKSYYEWFTENAAGYIGKLNKKRHQIDQVLAVSFDK